MQTTQRPNYMRRPLIRFFEFLLSNIQTTRAPNYVLTPLTKWLICALLPFLITFCVACGSISLLSPSLQLPVKEKKEN